MDSIVTILWTIGNLSHERTILALKYSHIVGSRQGFYISRRGVHSHKFAIPLRWLMPEKKNCICQHSVRAGILKNVTGPCFGEIFRPIVTIYFSTSCQCWHCLACFISLLALWLFQNETGTLCHKQKTIKTKKQNVTKNSFVTLAYFESWFANTFFDSVMEKFQHQLPWCF